MRQDSEVMAKMEHNSSERQESDPRGSGFTVCRSGPECLGPNKPARFAARNPLHQESIRSGYCAACRNAGRHQDNYQEAIHSHLREDLPVHRLLSDEEIASPHITLLTQDDLERLNVTATEESTLALSDDETVYAVPLPQEDQQSHSKVSFPEDFFQAPKVRNANKTRRAAEVPELDPQQHENQNEPDVSKAPQTKRTPLTLVAPATETVTERSDRTERSYAALRNFQQNILQKLSVTAHAFTPPTSLRVVESSGLKTSGLRNGWKEGVRSVKSYFIGAGRGLAAVTGLTFLLGGTILSIVGFCLPVPFVRGGIRAVGRWMVKLGKKGVSAVKPRNLKQHSSVPTYAGAVTMMGAAAVGASLVAFPWSLAVAAAGPLIGAAHAVYFTTRGILLGQRFDREWLSAAEWSNVNGLNDMEKKEKNDRFEQVTSVCFARIGYKSTLGGTQNKAAIGNFKRGDGGIDVLVEDSRGSQAVVSCKRYADKVQVAEVYELEGIRRRRGLDGAVLVTTHGFTEDARACAQTLGISLVTIEQLYELAARYDF